MYWNIRVNSNGYYLVELFDRGNAKPLFRRSFTDRLLAQDYCDLMNRKQLMRGGANA